MSTHWTDRLSEYQDGELSPAEHAACDAHLAECEMCRTVLRELQTGHGRRAGAMTIAIRQPISGRESCREFRAASRAEALPVRRSVRDLWLVSPVDDASRSACRNWRLPRRC